MLWVPLQPRQGGEEGNIAGNPHLDVDKVLSLWRRSVPEKTRLKWANIDPRDEELAVALPRPSPPQPVIEPEPVEVRIAERQPPEPEPATVDLEPTPDPQLTALQPIPDPLPSQAVRSDEADERGAEPSPLRWLD